MKNKKTLSGALNVLDVLKQKKDLNDYVKDAESSLNDPQSSDENKIYLIDPQNIRRWEYKDRPLSELGDIDSLAEEFKAIGQQQPCIVRPIEGKKEYELIVGERRWRAAQKANIKLKAIVSFLDDNTAALAQSAENDSRNDLSDFAKGMSLSKLISAGIIKQKDLQDKLGKTKQEVSRFLSFSRIEQSVFEAIADFSSITSRTAYEISRLSKKGDRYTQALINLSAKIRTGKHGANWIIRQVDKILNKPDVTEKPTITFSDNNGHALFTLRYDSKKNPSLHFSPQTLDLIESGKIDVHTLAERFKDEIMKFS